MDVFEMILNGDIAALKKNMGKIDLDEREKNSGFTALHLCAQEGKKEIAKLLIDNGASLDIKDNYGNTPLFKAVFFSKGDPEIIKMLLDAGANPDIKNDAGVSPRELAYTITNFDVKHLFK